MQMSNVTAVLRLLWKIARSIHAATHRCHWIYFWHCKLDFIRLIFSRSFSLILSHSFLHAKCYCHRKYSTAGTMCVPLYQLYRTFSLRRRPWRRLIRCIYFIIRIRNKPQREVWKKALSLSLSTHKNRKRAIPYVHTVWFVGHIKNKNPV